VTGEVQLFRGCADCSGSCLEVPRHWHRTGEWQGASFEVGRGLALHALAGCVGFRVVPHGAWRVRAESRAESSFRACSLMKLGLLGFALGERVARACLLQRHLGPPNNGLQQTPDSRSLGRRS
jgi:hypothetical protein